MGLQIVVHYRNAPVTYNVTQQESDVFHLKLNDGQNSHEEYVPEKVIIRKKGKIWVSDLEDYHELVDALTTEINRFCQDEDRIL